MPEPRCHCIIPARYSSSRFPGKPLASILGRPMFQHVVERCLRCASVASATLATDDERIAHAARELSIDVVMTSPDHASGTDRVREAADLLGLDDEDIVVNVQGDEPALDPVMIEEILAPFAEPAVRVATLAREIGPDDPEYDFAHPDRVKIVLTASGDALYFSRAPIPFHRVDAGREPGRPGYLAHIGMYAFRMEALRLFTSLPPSSLEMREQLEQLRLLENGVPIRVALTRRACQGVDRPEDIAIVEKLLTE